MGELKGFLTYKREEPAKEQAKKRVQHYREFVQPLSDKSLRQQGARCMDCGVPFCHQGCPLGNLIPEWNHLVSEEHWKQALMALLETNNFPEFTGRICPAPCETACVLGINEDPVAIEAIEMALADKGFAAGWIKAEPPTHRTGKSIAIVGSGPAGLAAAQQLNRKGHNVTVYERSDRPGGLLMYGIPDFKLEKSKVERRIKLLKEEGIEFRCGVNVGKDVSAQQLRQEHDALLLTCGATKKRDIPIPGRELKGVYFADELLNQSTRRQLGLDVSGEDPVLATGKNVIVIGGGDTGSDCVGTSNRQGAKSITQFEILDTPPNLGKFPRRVERPSQTPWPHWPMMLRTSTSHEEGCDRHWSLLTKEFIGDAQGRLKELVTQRVEWIKSESGYEMQVVEGSEKAWPCEMALIAIGFTGPETDGLVSELSLQLDRRGNVSANEQQYVTNEEGVFAAGDMRRGQSLVVWAIKEGRDAAAAIEQYLAKK